jgi:hypothetical protein
VEGGRGRQFAGGMEECVVVSVAGPVISDETRGVTTVGRRINSRVSTKYERR